MKRILSALTLMCMQQFTFAAPLSLSCKLPPDIGEFPDAKELSRIDTINNQMKLVDKMLGAACPHPYAYMKSSPTNAESVSSSIAYIESSYCEAERIGQHDPMLSKLLNNIDKRYTQCGDELLAVRDNLYKRIEDIAARKAASTGERSLSSFIGKDVSVFV